MRISISRLLIKSASRVLAGHCRLTISAALTGLPCLIRHGVNLRGSTYGKEYALPFHSLWPCRTTFLNSLQGI
jgi:hypothetical protein